MADAMAGEWVCVLRTAPRTRALVAARSRPLPPAPRRPAAWRPPPPLAGYFDHLFALAAEGGDEVTGQASVAFFTRSGLERSQLKQVWDAANLRGGRSLTRACSRRTTPTATGSWRAPTP